MFITKSAAANESANFQMKWLEVKSTEDGKIRIKGFASTPAIDRYDDIVQPTAFAGAMASYMQNPVILLGHDSGKVLGQVVEYALSAEGLEITAELSNDIDNTFKNIMDKNLRGFSIGLICKGFQYREEGGRQIREITSLDLVEISVVSTPANPTSLFTLTKSLKELFGKLEKKTAEEETEEPAQEEPKEEEAPTEQTTETQETTETEETGEEQKEAPTEEQPTEESKTETETPGGETPPTPPAEEVPASDTTEPVEGGEETPEEPAQAGITEDEVKSLIDAKTEELRAEIKAAMALIEQSEKSRQDLEKSFDNIVNALDQSETKYAALEKKHADLEADILKIEVRPAGAYKAAPMERKAANLSDEAILRTLGR